MFWALIALVSDAWTQLRMILQTSLQKSTRYLTAAEKKQLAILTILRSLTSVFDLVALVLVGLLLRLTTSEADWPKLASAVKSYSGTSPQYEEFIVFLSFATLCLFVGKSYVSAYLSKKTAKKISFIETRITTRLLANLIDLKNYKFSSFSSHELQNAVVLSATSAFTYLLVYAINFVTEAFLLLAIAILFFTIDPALTFILLMYFGIVGLFIQKKLGKQFRLNGESLNASIVSTQEKVADILNVRSEINFMKEQQSFVDSFRESRHLISSSNGNLMYLNSLPRYIIEASMLVGVALVTIIVFTSGEPNQAAGTVGIFLAGSLRMMASMLPLQSAISSIKQYSAQSSLFFQVADDLDLPNPELKPDQLPYGSAATLGEIRIEQVTKVFEATSAPAVKNVSLEIKSPCFAAFIGPSGSGKSTLVELMLGILEPTSGEVKFVDSHGLNIERSKVKFGYVPQVPRLIHGTLLDNILLRPDSSFGVTKSLHAAIEKAQISDLIESLPRGLETEISPQGNNFSGGQIQRIGIARALVQNPDVLILDEATSALDAETESSISNILYDISRRTIVIAIAHRMATVQSADTVSFLLDGEIKARGTLAELAKSEPTVAQYIQYMQVRGSDA